MKNREIAVENSGTVTEGEKIFNFRPVVFAAIFLCFGIVFAYFYLFYGVSAWWSLCVLPVLIAPFFFCRTRRKVWETSGAALLLVLSFVMGFGSFSRQIADHADCSAYDGEYNVVGTVVEKTEYDYSVKLLLKDLHIGENNEKGALIAYLPLSFCESVGVSDKVLLYGYVMTDTEYFNEYGFRANDIGNGVRFLLEDAESCVAVGKSDDLFLRIRARVEKTLSVGMSGAPAGVTLAVLTGDTSGIEEGLLENVRMGGIAHIFAVSGLHVGALYAFCLWLTEKTRLRKIPKPVRFLLMTALLIFYAGICGFSSSVMRAMILCLVSYAARLIGTESDMLQSTGLAAIIVLLIKPTELFAVGFQLSFAACLGIALLARPIRVTMEKGAEKIKIGVIGLFRLDERARPDPERRKLASPPSVRERALRSAISFASVSLAAQIATAPALLYSFGYLSLWGLLLNGVFMPFISAVFSVLLLFVTAASVLPVAAASVALYLPSVVWSAALLLFEGVDFSSFALVGLEISGGGMLCYYGGCQFLSDKWNIPKGWKYAFAIACFLSFGITMVALNG